jgi:hypothetical protein
MTDGPTTDPAGNPVPRPHTMPRWVKVFGLIALVLPAVVVGLLLWGLFRHYWVLISLVLTTVAVVVLLIETRVIHTLSATAADPATSVDESSGAAEHAGCIPPAAPWCCW